MGNNRTCPGGICTTLAVCLLYCEFGITAVAALMKQGDKENTFSAGLVHCENNRTARNNRFESFFEMCLSI